MAAPCKLKYIMPLACSTNQALSKLSIRKASISRGNRCVEQLHANAIAPVQHKLHNKSLIYLNAKEAPI
ncbi:MAG: hypothetical protein U1F98_10885 [Verrucomicrobiota bacterium]